MQGVFTELLLMQWGLLARHQGLLFIDIPENGRNEPSRLLLTPWELLMHEGHCDCVSDCLFKIFF